MMLHSHQTTPTPPMPMSCNAPPSISRSELVDRLQIMRDQETNKYTCIDYLESFASSNEGAIDKWCRSKMVQWCYSVVDFAKFNRETVYLSISYLDRFLSSNSPRSKQVLEDRKDYQLAAMTCLYLAIKIFEPKIIETGLLAELSRGCYTPQDFSIMETHILFDLNWLLHDPTPQSYLLHYLALIPTEKDGIKIDRVSILELARYQIELSVVDYDLMTKGASDIALAALTSSARLILAESHFVIDETELLASMGNIFTMEVEPLNISAIGEKLESLHKKQIPDLIRRGSNDVQVDNVDNEEESESIKSQPRRRSRSPNSCVST